MGASNLKTSFWLSVTAHTIFVVLCYILLIQQPTHISPPRLRWVEVVTQPHSQVAKKKEQKEQKDDSQKRQIVMSEDGFSTDRSRPDAFLGKRNQMVTEQTVSTSQLLSQAASQSKKKSQKHMQAKTPPLPSLSQLGLPILNHLEKINQDQGNSNSEMAREWAGEGDRVRDYVKGIKEGNQTALNTREYVFFGYFHRIRERLDRAWVPILRERLMKYHYSGRSLASNTDHSTRVLVVLNRHGQITRVQILSESGTQYLDDAAVKAFNEAGPFPNPPKGIIDKNNEIQIPWEFILRT